jgi:hypothetical protein
MRHAIRSRLDPVPAPDRRDLPHAG